MFDIGRLRSCDGLRKTRRRHLAVRTLVLQRRTVPLPLPRNAGTSATQCAVLRDRQRSTASAEGSGVGDRASKGTLPFRRLRHETALDAHAFLALISHVDASIWSQNVRV